MRRRHSENRYIRKGRGKERRSNEKQLTRGEAESNQTKAAVPPHYAVLASKHEKQQQQAKHHGSSLEAPSPSATGARRTRTERRMQFEDNDTACGTFLLRGAKTPREITKSKEDLHSLCETRYKLRRIEHKPIWFFVQLQKSINHFKIVYLKKKKV